MRLHGFFDPFREYASHVKKFSRFGQDQKTRDFIQYVLNTAESRRLHVDAGERFWRAQLGHSDIVSSVNESGEWAYDSIRPHNSERMTPRSQFVGNGRANPVGIAYWYGATDPQTAVAEMRPWLGALVSVAELQATRHLQLTDCGNTKRMVAPSNTEVDSKRERFVWNSIGEAFSRPIEPATIDIEYVPTQMLAEAFKTSGFDGIQYKSHLGTGSNVVVFELKAFEIGKRELWSVERLHYELLPRGEEKQEC